MFLPFFKYPGFPIHYPIDHILFYELNTEIIGHYQNYILTLVFY